MEFRDKAQIIIEVRTPDGYGGYVTEEKIVGEIKVKEPSSQRWNG